MNELINLAVGETGEKKRKRRFLVGPGDDLVPLDVPLAAWHRKSEARAPSPGETVGGQTRANGYCLGPNPDREGQTKSQV